MQIGPFKLNNNLLLAPMAGVTDRPFRQLCRKGGAGMAVSEMVSSKPELRDNKRTRLKSDHTGESEPRAVQIVGADPRQMAESAQFNADRGAQIIDINMGCPAKKVCNLAAGSALLKDERLVAEILGAVINAVNIPVTLKIRTGWDQSHRNAVAIAKIAESSGIQAISIHGRTRACRYTNEVEYDTIREVKRRISIPVIANGDIDSPEKAKFVLDYTGADAVMVGRAAQGQPWIFGSIAYFLSHGKHLPAPILADIRMSMVQHLTELYKFYGVDLGVRIARKHIVWYFHRLPNLKRFLPDFVLKVDSPRQQINIIESVFEQHQLAA